MEMFFLLIWYKAAQSTFCKNVTRKFINVDRIRTIHNHSESSMSSFTTSNFDWRIKCIAVGALESTRAKNSDAPRRLSEIVTSMPSFVFHTLHLTMSKCLTETFGHTDLPVRTRIPAQRQIPHGKWDKKSKTRATFFNMQEFYSKIQWTINANFAAFVHVWMSLSGKTCRHWHK